METGGQYGLPDIRHRMAGKAQRSSFMPDVPDPFLRGLHQYSHFGFLVPGNVVTPPQPTVPPPTPSLPPTTTQVLDAFGFLEEYDTGGYGGGFQGRWPRQETLTLLEVRSRLDARFREAVQKAPLWEEVSRIMAEEHGYHRSAKKCKEKLENLYKYYKKTTEGKAGRRNGKHYRFFRQLDALYGEKRNHIADNNILTNSPCFEINSSTNAQANQEAVQPHGVCESLNLSNSTGSDSSSTDKDDDDEEEKENFRNIEALQSNQTSREKTASRTLKRSRKSWRLKTREFADSQLRRLMKIQEAWFGKMLKALEHMEQERTSREEAWRRQEAARFDQEHRLWANERAWIATRDAALIEALERIGGLITLPLSLEGELTRSENETLLDNLSTSGWSESEVTSLINLRISMESKFRVGGLPGVIWEEISAEMACLGYNRSARRCEEKWEHMSKYFKKTKEQRKRHKGNPRECPCDQLLEVLCNHEGCSDRRGDDDLAPENNCLQPNETISTNYDVDRHGQTR